MKPLRMLVVEDEFLSRKLVGHYIDKYGKYDVAANGTEALEAFAAAYDEGRPYDVVFLDIMMPDKSGLAVLKEFRELESKRGVGVTDVVKVVMTTALGDAKSVMEAFRNQCEAYITKPYTEEAFAAQLRKLGLID